jgi:hypothetical protein
MVSHTFLGCRRGGSEKAKAAAFLLHLPFPPTAVCLLALRVVLRSWPLTTSCFQPGP